MAAAEAGFDYVIKTDLIQRSATQGVNRVPYLPSNGRDLIADG